ncbi:hypothetical protein CFC21_048000 [Triticum aestivum]|uniref:Uncharacterized protein n=2 Tax=Triticum aestivum TaxID=4565 RepID=A0A3B6GU37_WHEAT|nr:uncharacterized protein LOC123079116 [Triticum aestivum]KAF7037673.1 hypothetical protein CFC21_048000 [Triticum aestivum]
MAAAEAEAFSIRGFAARMRAVDAAKCWPFGGSEDGDSETPQLPPMDPTPRSRWWADELAALRALPGVCAAGGDFAVGGGMGDGLGKATKRKGSRGSGGAERAKRRRRALQYSLFLKHKERTSKLQPASRLLQHMLHKGLLRKRKGCTIPTLRELVMRKKLQERQDQMSTHRNSLKKQSVRGMDHERSIKISRPTDYPVNLGCEVVKHVACPPKDDIFGDLPLLESSKVMFHTGVDILPTIIEDSFVENQNGPDAISETEPLELMPIADISKQTSPPFEDSVKKEQSPDKGSTCILLNDAGRNHSSSAEFDGLLNHASVTMAKTSLPEMQLKSTDVPALSSYCNEGAKSGTSNCAHGRFYTNTDCFQEMERPGTSSVAVRTRTEAIKKEDAAIHGVNNASVTMAKTSLPETQLESTHVPALSSCSEAVRTRTEAIKKEDAAVHGVNNASVAMEKTSLPETQLESTHVPALSSYCNDGAKSCPSNHPQGCFYTNTNCFQEMKRPGTSSAAVRIITAAVTEDRDATVHGPNNTSVTMAKTCLPEMQLKSTHVPGLSSYCTDGAKSGSSNHPQDRFYTNTNCFQEMERPATSSAAVRTRTEAVAEDRDAAGHGLNNVSVTMAKTCLPEMQLKSTHGPVLSSYSKDGAKSGSSNHPQGHFYTNTSRFQEMTRPGTSSMSVRTRTEAIEKDRDAAVHGKKSTGISGRPEYHPSGEGNLSSSIMSQRTVNAGINADGMSSCRSMPAQEYAPASVPCKVASNVYHESRKSVDTCTALSMDDQGSWYSKNYSGRSPASISLPFMELPGLEKMEISSYDPRTGENNFMNGRSMNIVRCQQQKQVSGMTSTMQSQNKIGFSDSQAGKKAQDGFVRRDNCHSYQPTMRLMGKTVSLCKDSMEQEVPTTGKWIDKNVIGDRPPSVSCQLPPKKVFPYQDSVIPRTHVHESSDTLPRIPNSTFAEARPIVSDAQNHRLTQTNIVSSAVKDYTWNSGSQFGRQAQVNKEYVISNSRTRHMELSQPPELISIHRNQYLHLGNPASSMYAEEHTFVGSAVNRSSPSFPQWSLNTSMQGKYQNPTSLVYEDPRSVRTHQPPCQVPGANLFSASNISFHDYGTKNAESRNSYQRAHPSLPSSAASKFHDYCTKNVDSRYSYQGAHPSLSTSVASKSIWASKSTRDVLNIDGRKGVSLVDERSKRPGCADNVSQQPAKRQLVADKPELTSSMFPCMEKYSFGWSVNDTVGPRMLDFSNKNSRTCHTNIKK